MMPYTTEKTDASKKYAEVFTPPGVVFYMTLQDDVRNGIRDVDKTVLDPCCGHGQFPCAALVCKLFYQVGKLDEELALRVLKSIYGIDIQPESVEITRRHMLAALTDAFKFFTGDDFTRLDEATAIVNENFICEDFLGLSKRWTSRTIELF